MTNSPRRKVAKLKAARRNALAAIEVRYAKALERKAEGLTTGEVQPWKRERPGYQLTKEARSRRERAAHHLAGDQSPVARALADALLSVNKGNKEGGTTTAQAHLHPQGEKARRLVEVEERKLATRNVPSHNRAQRIFSTLARAGKALSLSQVRRIRASLKKNAH